MADQQHLDILKQGVEVWNQWNSKHYEIKPDLRGADLVQADLSNIILSDVDLSDADLTEASLVNATLVRTNLHGRPLSRLYLMALVYTKPFFGKRISGMPS